MFKQEIIPVSLLSFLYLIYSLYLHLMTAHKTVKKTVELVDVVDERNEVVGQAPLKDVHRDGLIHRTARVFIQNSKGEIFIVHKVPEKGGVWSGSSSGHIRTKEEPNDGALREASEELNVKLKIRLLAEPYFLESRIYNPPELDRAFHYVFLGEHDGPFNLERRELDDGCFKPKQEIRRMIEGGEKFSQGFVQAFNRFYKSL
jgi:isopentenyldiphosphate isomerase